MLDLDGNILWGPSQPISSEKLQEIITNPIEQPRIIHESSFVNAMYSVLKRAAHIWRWPYAGARDAVMLLREQIGDERIGVLTGRHESNLARITYGQLNRLFGFGEDTQDNIFLRPPGYQRSSDWKLAKLLDLDEERKENSAPIILIDNEVGLAARVASVAEKQNRNIYVILKESYATTGKEEELLKLKNLRMYSDYNQWTDIINEIISDSQSRK